MPCKSWTQKNSHRYFKFWKFKMKLSWGPSSKLRVPTLIYVTSLYEDKISTCLSPTSD